MVELFEVQVEDWNLHGAGCLTFLAVRAFHRVPVDPQHTVLLKGGHDGADGADVPAPEAGDAPSSVDETDQDENVQPGQNRDA